MTTFSVYLEYLICHTKFKLPFAKHRALVRAAACGSSLATFASAGFVRRGLIEAGFSMRKVPGFGKKWEMLQGHYSGPPQPAGKPWYARPPASEERRALVIGGGINGAVAAAALSGGGASVALIDQRDFAGFTSQQSSNLAWGGIKYLESNDFGLVWKLCKSRNHLIENYPSRVEEIRFYSAIERGFRFPPRFIWLGTWLYWLFGNTFTAIPRWLPKKVVEREEPRINTRGYSGAFEYSDAYLHEIGRASCRERVSSPV